MTLRVALTAAVTATALALSAAPAAAATTTVTDPTKDVWLFDGVSTWSAAASKVNTDLVRTYVKHGTDKVLVRGTYVSLAKSGPPLTFVARVRTDEGVVRILTVDTITSLSGTVTMSTAKGSAVACSGLSRTVDYAAEQVTVSFPRSCISKPAWVQVATMAWSQADGDQSMYFDNGKGTGHSTSPSWSGKVLAG